MYPYTARSRKRSRRRNNVTSSGSLASVIPSTVADWDATQFASYGGTGQFWNSLVTSPADGSPQSAYQQLLGSSSSPSTDDPTFTGTAGSPSAYFSFDGGDRLTLANANTVFLNALHKTTGGTPFWMAAVFRVGDAATSFTVLGTNSSTPTGRGIRLNQASTEQMSLVQGDGTVSKSLSGSSLAQTIGAYICVIYSYDGANARRWINTNTKTVTPNTLNTATADALDTFASFVNAPAGTEAVALSIGNAYIDDADVAKIIQTYWNRHNRGYGLYPVNTVAPTISGTQIVGSTLTTTDGTWDNTPTFTYQWIRNGVNIVSATANTYVLTVQDLGSAITCRVTGTANGQSKGAVSNTLNIANNLSAVVAGAVFQHDATMAASYDGSSQTWANLIASPADGSGQAVYDMVLGTTSSPQTSDPTFVGSAGNNAAYFMNDGGDLFTLNGANTTLLDNLHKSTPITPFTMICAFNPADQSASAFLMGTTTSNTANGIRLSITSTELTTIAQNDGTTGLALGSSLTALISQPTLFIGSWDGTTYRRWMYNRTQTSNTQTFNTTTTSASATFLMFRNLAADSRFYGDGLLNTAITLDAEAARIFDAYNLWHNRTYA
jgi:hypothetical protein